MQLRMFCSPIVIKLTLVGFLFSLAPFPLAGQQTKLPQKAKKFNVAVLDFDARAGISKDEAASLSDAFSSEIIRIGEFVVVDRNRLRSILQEQGFQQSEACSQVECVVEVGRILKVEKMFVGTVGKVGNTFTVTIQVVDVQSSHIEATVNKPYRGEIDGLLTEVIPSIAVELSGKLTGKEQRRGFVALVRWGCGAAWRRSGCLSDEAQIEQRNNADQFGSSAAACAAVEPTITDDYFSRDHLFDETTRSSSTIKH
jgi:TolB-like protein